jgi:hypothetical protein
VMKECCICLLDAAVDDLLIIMPCAHRCVCEACAARVMLRPAASRLCPKCREPVVGASRVFDD